ncbi:GNAT family N-acetyltransferase [Halapricum hydrolyticum]|uniref:N-acetyltransferase n=1 Tax=Halapricum hydrolyticum TaxID=2979991 RepID=A0AAE3I9V9_9EURY|nr:N-acetyltransferase [Halapricum hydrolyticum]MCU4717200.1 N-acetyltransferase [Halapricum hydrolyticum]MCU4726127.1 N-acetyltransferase [Halapricum hydrolyticum]
MVDIEPATAADPEAIRPVLTAAFEDETEAELVDVLREEDALRADCSLLAREEDPVGFVAVSDAELPAAPGAEVVVLGPVGVVPDRHGEGIGSKLVREAMRCCVRAGCTAVVLEGDPEFYEQFGFEPASAYGLESDLDPPPGAFQVWPCRPGTLEGVSGEVRHPIPFHAL